MPQAHEQLATLAEDILRAHCAERPVQATNLGIHDHDGRLGDHSPERYQRELEAVTNFQTRLRAIDRATLAPSEQTDWDLLSAVLEDNRQDLEQDRAWLTRPDHYVEDYIAGCYGLIARDFAPAAQRAEPLLQRLEQVPRVLAQAQANLQSLPAVLIDVSLAEARGGISLFTDMVPTFAAQVPTLAPRLTAAAERAAAAVTGFVTFLERDLAPRAGAGFALGRERFNWKLRNYYRLPYDADSLRARGEEWVQESLTAMADLARRIDPTADWRETVDRIKNDHPAADGLMAAYEQTTASARRFIVDRDLVPLPPGEELQILETPPFMRPGIAYAAYWPPGPFEASQVGRFYVTPVDPAAPAAQQAEQLQGHNWPSVKVTALHEAYPGHHLQLTWANRHPSTIRHLAANILFMEGWTLWCERMMDEEGWLASPQEKLIRLKDELWRACRVVLDPSLHVHGLDPEAAIRYLAETAALEPANARTEVLGYYCRHATVPMSYLVGREQLLNLKADYQARAGTAFSLKQFHTELLSHGSIPFHYVRQAMLVD